MTRMKRKLHRMRRTVEIEKIQKAQLEAGILTKNEDGSFTPHSLLERCLADVKSKRRQKQDIVKELFTKLAVTMGEREIAKIEHVIKELSKLA